MRKTSKIGPMRLKKSSDCRAFVACAVSAHSTAHPFRANSTAAALRWAAPTLPATCLQTPRLALSLLLRAPFSLPDKVCRFRQQPRNPLLPRLRLRRPAPARRKRLRGDHAVLQAANFG